MGHPERKFNLPTIDCQGRTVSFRQSSVFIKGNPGYFQDVARVLSQLFLDTLTKLSHDTDCGGSIHNPHAKAAERISDIPRKILGFSQHHLN